MLSFTPIGRHKEHKIYVHSELAVHSSRSRSSRSSTPLILVTAVIIVGTTHPNKKLGSALMRLDAHILLETAVSSFSMEVK